MDHGLTHRGHTPLGAAYATAYVHARDLTATATNHRALRARHGYTPCSTGPASIHRQPCVLCGGLEETWVHMHVGCADSRLLWPHYRQAVQEAARHLLPGDKALWVASSRSIGAAWTEVFRSGLVLKRYPEPRAHGPEAFEPSHPCGRRSHRLSAGYPCSLIPDIWNAIPNC